MNRLLLEAAYPKLIAKSQGGVYPDREIYISNPGGLAAVLPGLSQGRRKRAQHVAGTPQDRAS